VSLAALLFVGPNNAVAAQNCTVVQDRKTLDTFMQGLGGAGSFVMLVSKEGPVWVRMAAAAGLVSVVWSVAKSYFDTSNQQPTVCVERFPKAPPQIIVGPPSLLDNNAPSNDGYSSTAQQIARQALQSQSTQQLMQRPSQDNSLPWTQLCPDVKSCLLLRGNNPSAPFAPDSGAR
jgi:hypothetical protein